MPTATVNIRPARMHDAHVLGEIHVASWRVAYAGLLPVESLERLSVTDRRRIWSERLRARPDGVTALVAGATRSAGRAIAVELGTAGATVYVTGRSTRERRSEYDRPETIEETAELVTRSGGHGIAVQVDHLDERQVRALTERIDREYGRLDVLVNDVWGGEKLFEWNTTLWQQSFLYTELGYRVVAFSRPGYGRTAVGDLTAAEFVPAVAEACAGVGITAATATVGMSFGGLQAVHVASRLPHLAPRLVLHSCAPSSLPYPDGLAEHLVAPLAFAPGHNGSPGALCAF
ncbi:Alpha/beta hydrolase family protein [Actinopolyspora lacussalsi subsp. righensis]|uniref:Alpha/beta hydrolase family protein n=1 Tax=Actinopolyspora righensis TaxID=995060 RepID=A0A1I7C4W4_9ACTN|nr:SDR family NAD(P)-dependent oxidoreductase [Actinopolyspora righensis]SFT94446.1 Alpha/beta hydrolase family protein [Actinopolyspora righensis]